MTSTLPSRELLNELKLAKGKNSLIFAITEDPKGLSRLLSSNNVDVHLVDLRDSNHNPFEMLTEWESTPDDAVYLVFGISDQFPWILGYLNLHRDHLYQIKRPILIALSEYEISEIQKQAPDLYRYRSRTYDLKTKRKIHSFFSEAKPEYYKLPIFEEDIDVNAIRNRIGLDKHMLIIARDEYKKAEIYMDLAISYFKLDDIVYGNIYSRRSMDIRNRLKDGKGILINYSRLLLVFLSKRDFEKVVELSKILLELDPTSASTYLFSGIAYAELGKSEIAIECYEKAIEIDPKYKDAWYYKGSVLADLERQGEALACFDKAIDLDPKFVHAWNKKGRALVDLGRQNEALVCFDKAIDLDPKFVHAWSGKGSALRYWGRQDEALICFDKAIDLDPKYVHAWSGKGLSLSDMGRKDEALVYFDKAIHLDPKFVQAWNGKGHTLVELGRQYEALVCLDKAINLDPKLAIAWSNKGAALSYLSRTEEELACLDKAIDLDPKLAIAWSNKGAALSNLGRTEEALACFDKAINLDPKYAMAWFTKSVALSYLGRNEEAFEACKGAAELGLKSAVLYIAFARLCRNLGKEDHNRAEACKTARDLIEKESEYNRACFEAVCGSPDAALDLLRTALEKRQETVDWARRDPDFESLRDDPRFEALLDEFSEDGKKGPK